MMDISTARKAVKAYLKANLSAALPAPLSKIDDKPFDPTTSGKNECLVRLPDNTFDQYHTTVNLDLFLCVWKVDEDDLVGALFNFFDAHKVLGGAVTLADIKSVDLTHDLNRPGFLLATVGVELTV